MEMYEVTERLALTEEDDDGNQRLVPENDPSARWFFAAPGQLIPLDDAQRYGLSLEPKTVAASDPETEPVVEKPKRTRSARKTSAKK